MSASIIINPDRFNGNDKKIECWAPESFMDEIEIKLGKNIRLGESFDMKDIEILNEIDSDCFNGGENPVKFLINAIENSNNGIWVTAEY